MIKLKDLLKENEDPNKNPNVASIEDEREWKMPDVDHMFSMKFEREGESVFILKNPAMRVYKVKNGSFILEEPIENHQNDFQKGIVSPMKPQGMSAFNQSKHIEKHEFPTFIKLINFFDTYKQD